MAWGPLALTQRMDWHDIQNPDDKLLDELAARYSLHPLHVEDCRQDAQRTKAETGEGYLFISLKQMAFDDSGRLATGDLVLFVGGDFLLTVHRAPVALLEPLRAAKGELQPDQVLYRVMDAFVESYIPLVERLENSIERLEDVVVGAPRPTVLQNIGEARSTLLELRRVLNGTRYSALPGLVITSIFGMNIEYPSWVKSHSMFAIVMMTSLAVTVFLLWYLRRKDYLPGGTTSGSTNN